MPAKSWTGTKAHKKVYDAHTKKLREQKIASKIAKRRKKRKALRAKAKKPKNTSGPSIAEVDVEFNSLVRSF